MSKSKVLEGVVVSTKMNKTAVVSVSRSYMHLGVGKSVKVAKKYKVHDESESCVVGDVVRIVECAPISKSKHMKLDQVITKK